MRCNQDEDQAIARQLEKARARQLDYVSCPFAHNISPILPVLDHVSRITYYLSRTRSRILTSHNGKQKCKNVQRKSRSSELIPYSVYQCQDHCTLIL